MVTSERFGFVNANKEIQAENAANTESDDIPSGFDNMSTKWDKQETAAKQQAAKDKQAAEQKAAEEAARAAEEANKPSFVEKVVEKVSDFFDSLKFW